VLILSAYAEPQLVHGALTRGAAGYLSKEAEGEEISRAVVTAAQGEKVVSTRLLAGVLAEIGRQGRSEREARADRPSLTRREREVLSLVAEGRTAREIARELYLSYATVKTHLHNIYDKLGVSDRAGAVSVALRRRLLE
jgi:two-component system, NarL family, nitrate/nitrite response regulator NarL